MKKQTYISTFILLSFLAFSCGHEDKNKAKIEDALIVTVSDVQSNNNNPFLLFSGKIQATNSADLSTRIMGFVNKIHVKVGDKVNKGQLLVSINNTDLQARQAQVESRIVEANVAFKNAEKDYTRFKNLFSENSASQKELDNMTASFEIAKARLESAKQMKNEINSQFAYSNIIAPFSGVVTNKYIKAGDMANPGIPLISIESPGNFEVIASVPEKEISQIKSGTNVDVIVKSINKTVKGKVVEISASAKNSGGQYLVKIILDKTEEYILSGMFATIQFPVKKSVESSMVLIPFDVLVKNGELSGVYTVSQRGTAILRWLRLGRSYGNQIEVLSGLSAGETYIVSSEGKLYNGVKIKIQ